MRTAPSLRWRLPLLAAGLLIVLAPPHPRGDLAQMMGHADWTPGHSMFTAGLVALVAALLLFRRGGAVPARTARWLRYATAAAVLQALEMAVHTASVVDHGNLVAGRPTPVLTTHLAMAVVVYPLFAAGMIGLMVAGARDGVLGSWWIAWIGIVGVAAHGIAAPLVIVGGMGGISFLFAGFVVLGLWFVLASLWPVRAHAGAAAADAPHAAAPRPVPAGR